MYDGKRNEGGIGLVGLWVRMYDASLGRFTAVDPIVEILQEAWTPYHYVKNNPIKYIDPDGMIWKDQKEADALIDKVLDKLKSVSAEKAQTQEEFKNDDLSDKKKEELQKR